MTRAERIAALETEAVRLKERLDVMNAQIAGDQDAWLHLTLKMPDTVAEVYVDKVLAEARQHSLALATVVKTLESLKDEGAGQQASAEDELVKRRNARKAARSSVQPDAVL
jgi:hypothetical protein